MFFQIQALGFIARSPDSQMPNLPVREDLLAAGVGSGHYLIKAGQAGPAQRRAKTAVEPYTPVVGRLESQFGRIG